MHYFCGGVEAYQFFLLNFIASKETDYAIVTAAANHSALVCSYAGGLRNDPMALATVLSGRSRRVSVVSTETPF